MLPAALTLLAQSPILLRLSATWPRVERSLDERTTFERWARISGVPISMVIEQAPILFENRICRRSGETDEVAQKYIAHHALRGVEDGRRRKP